MGLFELQNQWTPLIAMDRDGLLIKFTWCGHAEIYECGYVPVCKAGVMSIKIIIISIGRHFINITCNCHNHLIKQVLLTASFYKRGKWDSYKKIWIAKVIWEAAFLQSPQGFPCRLRSGTCLLQRSSINRKKTQEWTAYMEFCYSGNSQVVSLVKKGDTPTGSDLGHSAALRTKALHVAKRLEHRNHRRLAERVRFLLFTCWINL